MAAGSLQAYPATALEPASYGGPSHGPSRARRGGKLRAPALFFLWLFYVVGRG